MNAKALTDDEVAVSPVVGVVLMVAITVLLAATAAVFVTGLGSDKASGTPTTAFDFEYSQSGSGDELTISHASGDTVEAGTVAVSIRGAAYEGTSDDPNGQYDLTTVGSLGSNSEVTAGTSVTVTGSDLSGSGDLDLSDATVEVVWRSPDGDQSATLTTWLNE
jgi:flagellin-like protein